MELVVQLGKALHSAGSPAHRIEEGMAVVSRRFGIAGQFFSTPTALFASFHSPEGRRTLLERVDPGDVDLERLVLLDELLAGLAAGRLAQDEAAGRLAEIAARPARYGRAATALAFGPISAVTAFLFGGGWEEILASLLVGLIPGGLGAFAARHPLTQRLFEPLAAVAVAFAATSWAALVGGLSPFVVTLSGLIVLVPGLTLTTSISELATRHLVSGSARFAGAVTVLFGLALGVALGRQAAVALFAQPAVWTPEQLGPAWRWLALPLAAVAFAVLFRARPRDAGWILVAVVVGSEGVRLGGWLLGPQLGAFVGALVVGIGGNVFARARQRPSAVFQVPGLIVLVPGSLGLRSLAALLEQDVLAGVQTAFTTTLIGITLATGLLLANVVVPPRRVL